MPIPPTDKSTDPSNGPMEISPSAIITDVNPIPSNKLFPASTDPVQIWSDAEMDRRAVDAIGKPEWLRRKHLITNWVKQIISSKESQKQYTNNFLMMAATMNPSKWQEIEMMPMEMRFFHLSKLLNPEDTSEI